MIQETSFFSCKLLLTILWTTIWTTLYQMVRLSCCLKQKLMLYGMIEFLNKHTLAYPKFEMSAPDTNGRIYSIHFHIYFFGFPFKISNCSLESCGIRVRVHVIWCRLLPFLPRWQTWLMPMHQRRTSWRPWWNNLERIGTLHSKSTHIFH